MTEKGSTMTGLLVYSVLCTIMMTSASVFDQNSVDDEYIVQLGQDLTTKDDLERVPGITIIRTYNIGSLQYALVKSNSTFSPASLAKNVKLVPNRLVKDSDIQGFNNQGLKNNFDDQGLDFTTNTFENNPSNECYQQESGWKYWGLSRISRVDRPNFDTARYLFNSTGEGVNIYIVDTGINVNHQTFGQRARVGYTVDDIRESEGEMDLDGHGTHVAGLAAGNIHNYSNL